jgi:hypothetical protein
MKLTIPRPLLLRGKLYSPMDRPSTDISWFATESSKPSAGGDHR